MHNLITIATIFLFSLVTQSGSCGARNIRSSNTNSNMQTSVKNDRLPKGIWGGQHVHAEIKQGGAEFEFDCAHGSISQVIVLDGSGKFDVPGKFATEHGGPVRPGDENNDRSVRYSGTVKDQEMTLTITDASNKELIGTFTLKYGNEGRLMKCR